MFALRRLTNSVNSTLSKNSLRNFSVQTVNNVDQLKSIIEENRSSDKLLVIDWFATWCGPCRAFSPVFHKLAEQNPNVNFYVADVDQVDADELDGMPTISAVPSFFLIKNGQCIEHMSGANEALLSNYISDHSS